MARMNPKMNFVRNTVTPHGEEDYIHEEVISTDAAADLLDESQMLCLATGVVSYVDIGASEYIEYKDATNLLR